MPTKVRATEPTPTRAVGVHFEGDLRPVLLEAARAEHLAVGSERMSLRAVARRAGVSHAAPAHHFGDKEGLLTALASEGFRILLDALDSAAADTPDVATGLARLGAAYADFAEAHPSHFDVMFRSTGINRDDPEYLEVSAAAYDALGGQVALMQRSGWRVTTPLDELTTATWALVHGLSALRAQGALDARHPAMATTDIIRIAGALTSTENLSAPAD
ncbi:MAG: TetR/AcrR family transcriptional regulator [Actinomycetia bacterium]|nr:TetR/AcrR family transcriptional regulator [Actinomycetes bacterium]